MNIIKKINYKYKEINNNYSTLLRGARIIFATLIIIIVYYNLIVFTGDKLIEKGYEFDFGFIFKDKRYMTMISQGYINTVIISVFSLILSVIIGLIIAIMKKSKSYTFKFLAVSFSEIIIGTPLLVQIIIFYYFVGTAFKVDNIYIGNFKIESSYTLGTLILSIFYGAFVAEIFRSGIESIDKQQWESARSLGFTKIQQYRYLIIPQLIKQMLPPLAGQFSLVVKGSALLSVISIAEFTKKIQEVDSMTFKTAELYIYLAIGYLIITIPISIATKYFENRFKIQGDE